MLTLISDHGCVCLLSVIQTSHIMGRRRHGDPTRGLIVGNVATIARRRRVRRFQTTTQVMKTTNIGRVLKMNPGGRFDALIWVGVDGRGVVSDGAVGGGVVDMVVNVYLL